MKRLVILASGNGSNFEAISKAINQQVIKANIVCLISDQLQAGVIQKARNKAIAYTCLNYSGFAKKSNYHQRLLQTCAKHKPDYIILAGYMRLLKAEFVQHFKGQIINIHPSLLPSHPGLNAIEKAYASKDSMTGVTVHYVDEGMDTGPIIAQESIEINRDNSLQLLEKNIHTIEHALYVEVLKKLT